MPHPFSTKRIDHSGGISNRDELSRQVVVGQWPRHETARPVDVILQAFLPNHEAVVAAATFDRNSPTVSFLKKPEIEDARACSSGGKVHAEFVDGYSRS